MTSPLKAAINLEKTQKILRKPGMIFSSRQLTLINQLIRVWQNDSDMMKLLKVLSKKGSERIFLFFLITTTVSNPPAWRQNKAILNFQQLQMPEPKAHGRGR